MAELGLVGDGPNSYQLWLGGSPNQTRLAETFQDRVKVQVRDASCWQGIPLWMARVFPSWLQKAPPRAGELCNVGAWVTR